MMVLVVLIGAGWMIRGWVDRVEGDVSRADA